ncbi:peptidylprolyl isomerase [Thermodesulfobacteriota bacterium]
MAEAKSGDKVRVHFTGRLEDGTVFGSTMNEEPFEFEIGEKNMLPGFENAVIGMQKGETKTISLAPEEAYGPHKKELVHIMDRSSFPPEINLEIGKRLSVRTQDGKQTVVAITDIAEDHIVIDENEPLAGKTLTFKIELVEVI